VVADLAEVAANRVDRAKGARVVVVANRVNRVNRAEAVMVAKRSAPNTADASVVQDAEAPKNQLKYFALK